MSRHRKQTVLVVLGSPRKRGNSALLAAEIARGAKRAGATIRTVFLQALHIQPCQGCWKCRKAGSTACVIPDEMQPVYPQTASQSPQLIPTSITRSASSTHHSFMEKEPTRAYV
jgi:hypothetical protein